ncbi:MAG: hypothetical protein WDZ77_00700 [Candidatus Pacearchaeota archaeon]
MKLETIQWLIKDFSLDSTYRVLIYYLKKKIGKLDYNKTFRIYFNFNGKKIKMIVRENNDDFAIIREIFLFNAYKTPFKKIKTVVDVGSHIGSSVIYFNSIFPES